MLDHKWIKFKLLADELEPRLYRDPRKTDWDIFPDSLTGNQDADGDRPRSQDEVEVA